MRQRRAGLCARGLVVVGHCNVSLLREVGPGAGGHPAHLPHARAGHGVAVPAAPLPPAAGARAGAHLVHLLARAAAAAGRLAAPRARHRLLPPAGAARMLTCASELCGLTSIEEAASWPGFTNVAWRACCRPVNCFLKFANITHVLVAVHLTHT